MDSKEEKKYLARAAYPGNALLYLSVEKGSSSERRRSSHSDF